MASDGLTVHLGASVLSTNRARTEAIVTTKPGAFNSVFHEEADPSGRDPFDIKILDPDLARRLGYL